MADIKTLVESFDTPPFQWKFEKKFGESDHIYVFDDDDGHSFKLHFEKQQGFGKKVFRVMLSQRMPSLRMYKRIIGVFKGPMKVIATVLAITEDFMVNNKGKVNGLAMGVPAKSFGAYMRLVDRIVKRKFMAKINIIDSDFQAPEVEDDGLFYRYLLVAPHRKDETFNGKWVVGKFDQAAVINTDAASQVAAAIKAKDAAKSTSAKDTAAVSKKDIQQPAVAAPVDLEMEEIKSAWVRKNFEKKTGFEVTAVLKDAKQVRRLTEDMIVEAFSWTRNFTDCVVLYASLVQCSVPMTKAINEAFNEHLKTEEELFDSFSYELKRTKNSISGFISAINAIRNATRKEEIAKAWMYHLVEFAFPTVSNTLIIGYTPITYGNMMRSADIPHSTLLFGAFIGCGILNRANFNKAFAHYQGKEELSALFYPWVFPMFMNIAPAQLDKKLLLTSVQESFRRFFGEDLLSDPANVDSGKLRDAMAKKVGDNMALALSQDFANPSLGFAWLGVKLTLAPSDGTLKTLMDTVAAVAKDDKEVVRVVKEYVQTHDRSKVLKEMEAMSISDLDQVAARIYGLQGYMYKGSSKLHEDISFLICGDAVQFYIDRKGDDTSWYIAQRMTSQCSMLDRGRTNEILKLAYPAFLERSVEHVTGKNPLPSRYVEHVGRRICWSAMTEYLYETELIEKFALDVIAKCDDATVESLLVMAGMGDLGSSHIEITRILDVTSYSFKFDVGDLGEKLFRRFVDVNRKAFESSKSSADFVLFMVELNKTKQTSRFKMDDRFGVFKGLIQDSIEQHIDQFGDDAPGSRSAVTFLGMMQEVSRALVGRESSAKSIAPALDNLFKGSSSKDHVLLGCLMDTRLFDSMVELSKGGQLTEWCGDVNLDAFAAENFSKYDILIDRVADLVFKSPNRQLTRAMANAVTADRLAIAIGEADYGRHNRENNAIEEFILASHEPGDDAELTKKIFLAGLRSERRGHGLTDEQHNDIKNLYAGSLLPLYEKDPGAAEAIFKGIHASYKKRVATGAAVMADLVQVVTDNDPIRMMKSVDARGFAGLLEFNGISVDPRFYGTGTLPKTLKEAKESADQAVADIRAAVPKQQVTKIDQKQEELDKLTVAYDFYNKYRHGGLSVEFLEVYDCHLPSEIDTFVAENGGDIIEPAFHGTGSIAASMIMRTGFRIITGNGVIQTTGKMLGNGIYFSNVLDKVAQYVSDDGYQRGIDQEGYIFEMKAACGKARTHHRSAGFNGSTDGNGVISPEWAVFSPRQQLKVKKVYRVRLIRPKQLEEIKRRVAKTSVVTENTLYLRGFKHFLKESAMSRKGVTTYVFMDGTIPVAPGKWVPAEQFAAKRFGRHVHLEPSAIGWMVMIDTDETETVSVRYTPQFAHREDDMELFLKRLSGK